MDENSYTPQPESNNDTPFQLPQITLESLSYLRTAGQWTKFLAILGFIGIGLMLLLGIVMGVVMNLVGNIPTSQNIPFIPLRYLSLIYFVMAAIYLMPVIYLNNFSNYIKKAVYERETFYLTTAFLNIKRHFKFLGIMVIVGIVCYFFFIIAMVIFMSHTVLNHSL